MTEEAIQKQIEIIREAGREARKSKESARQFLIDAGILRPKDEKDLEPEIPNN